jgi:hypothetical protein
MILGGDETHHQRLSVVEVHAMTISIKELAQTREATTELLDELGFEAYLFEVEPNDKQWELKVDCAMEADGAWESITLWLSKEMLLTSQDNASLRQRIIAEWHDRFVACKLVG